MPEGNQTRIGKYEIQAELGRGGFGRVYRGFDPIVGRPVAIKVLTIEGDRDILTRFRNEAVAAGTLRHRNIVTIYEFGEHEGLPFLVMEYLEGEDLQHVISNHQPLSLLQKMNIMSQIAEGLDCAHRNGVVHRDVKPANMMVLRDGAVKVMDFGIARLTRDREATRLTRQGDLIGTLLYMAPEQLMGGDVDALCDIFAFGVIYYELLAGRHPFQGPNPRAILYNIVSQEPPPLRDVAPECPEALEQIIRRALNKERELRYQSLRDLQLDAEPILIELQRERAAGLLVSAQAQLTEGELETAQATLLEVLHLDPANRDARRLRETIQQRLRERALQVRVMSLLEEADHALANGRFEAAINSLDSGLRLDPSNAAVRERLERARAAKGRAEKFGAARDEGRRLVQQQAWKDACERLSAALEIDPENTEARMLLVQANEELEAQKARERESRLAEVRQRALEHKEALKFEEALRVLDQGLEEQPNEATLLALREDVAEAWGVHKRREAVERAIEEGRSALEEKRVEAAIQGLERALAEYPDEREISSLLERARRDSLARQAAAEAEALRGEGRFGEAVDVVRVALHQLGEEAGLAELASGLQAELADAERRTAVEVALRAGTVEALRAALAKYPDERALRAALERAEAVEAALSAGSIEALREALTKYPDEGGLRAALERMEAVQAALSAGTVDALRAALAKYPEENSIRAALERADTVQEAVRTGTVEALRAALAKYPDERALRAALERAEAVEAALSAGSIEALREALTKYPDEGGLRAALERMEAVQAALSAGTVDALRAALAKYPEENSIRAALERADTVQEAVRAGTVEALRAALVKYPDERALRAALDRVEAVEAALSAGTVDALRAALAKYPEENSIRAALERADTVQEAVRAGTVEALQAALAKYPDEGAVRAALERVEAVEAALRTGTVEALRAALVKYPDERALRAALDRVEAVEAALSAGTVDALRAALAKYPEENSLRAALERADTVQEAVRAGTVEALRAALAKYPDESALRAALDRVEAVEAALSAGTVDALRAALAKYPGENSLRAALERAEKVKEALRAGTVEALRGARAKYPDESALRAALQRVETVQAALRSGTVEALREALAKYPDESALHAALERVEAVETALRARTVEALREALAKYPEENSLRAALERAERVQAALRAGTTETLRAALTKYPDESALRAALERTEAVEAALRAGTVEALRAALAKYPDDSTLRAALGRADTVQEALRSGTVEALRAALAKYPDESGLLAGLERALAERDRRDGIANVLDRAAGYRKKQRLARAIEVVEEALGIFGDDANLRRMRIDLALEQAARLEQDYPEDAVGVLRTVLTDYPQESDLRAALARAEAVREQRNARRQALDRAASLRSEKRLGDAIAAIDTALAQHGDDPMLKHMRADLLAESAAQMLERDHADEAAELLRGALARQPEDSVLRVSLEKAEAAHGRRNAIRKALDQAGSLRREKRFHEAVEVLDAADAATGGSDGQLGAMRAEIEREWKSHNVREGVRAAAGKARLLLEQGQPQEAATLLEAALRGYPHQAELTALLVQAREQVTARKVLVAKPEVRAYAAAGGGGAVTLPAEAPPSPPTVPNDVAREELPPPVAPAPPSRGSRKLIYAGAALVAAVAAVVTLTRKPGGDGRIAFEVATTPPGATVRIQDQTCVTPDCKFALAPGTYPVEARIDGYQSAKTTLSLRAGQKPPSAIRLSLTPLQPVIQISTNLEAGTVKLNGQPAGSLQEGQLTLDRVPPGKHELELSGGDASATIAFETTPQRRLVVGETRVRNVEAVVVSSFGKDARVVTSGAPASLRVDGKPAEKTGPEGADLHNLSEGTHELSLGDGSAERKMAFRVTATPTLNLLISADRDVGTLIVETGVDDASVFINDRRYKRRSSRGFLRIPLEARKYVVRVQKPGYIAEPESLTTEIRKGEQLRASFQLRPAQATLSIAAAMPGTVVTVDGRRAGTVPADGRFSATLDPGQHAITLEKQGYKPRQFTRVFEAGGAVALGQQDAQLAVVPPVRAPEPPKAATVDPKVLEAQDWERVRGAEDRTVVENFLRKYPGGAHSDAASRRLEQLDWNGVNKADRAALESFLGKHPNGALASQAKGEIARLDQQATLERSKAEEARKRSLDRQSVEQALARYAAAYSRKDLDGVAAAWPSAPKKTIGTMRGIFRDFRSVSLQVQPVGEPNITQETATVKCVRVFRYEDEQGVHPYRDTVTIALNKAGAGWVIASIE